MRSLLDKILVADPAKRIGLAQIAKDPWFCGGEKKVSAKSSGDVSRLRVGFLLSALALSLCC